MVISGRLTVHATGPAAHARCVMGDCVPNAGRVAIPHHEADVDDLVDAFLLRGRRSLRRLLHVRTTLPVDTRYAIEPVMRASEMYVNLSHAWCYAGI